MRRAAGAGVKVFWFFFSKKNRFVDDPFEQTPGNYARF
jgi:hypothetical protein